MIASNATVSAKVTTSALGGFNAPVAVRCTFQATARDGTLTRTATYTLAVRQWNQTSRKEARRL